MSTDKKTFIHTDLERTADAFVTSPARLERVRERITDDVRRRVDGADADGVVVAMSGGIDSTLTTALAVDALGPDRVLGLGLPCHKAERAAVADAHTIADGLGVAFEEIQLQPLLEAFDSAVASAIDPDDAERPTERNRPLGNLLARFRMACAYYAANRQSRLVLGTGNRSELLLGYFTKHGDGAADCFPIGDLYKTEVRALAAHLGLPRRIVAREPTAGFWAGQTDAGELGAPYEVIDPLLRRLVDEGTSLEKAVDGLEIDRETAAHVASLHAATGHKRARPPTPDVVDRRP